MKILIGLGNPGEEYENTYHNVGQLALLALARATGKAATWKKHKNLFEYAEINDEVFARPLAYMNESGKAAQEMLKKFKAKPENLIVLQDDSDITIGDYKISYARSSAGHKGVQSIIDTLKTNAFSRIRIGIRPAREKLRQKAGEFALKQITKNNMALFEKVFDAVIGDKQTSS